MGIPAAIVGGSLLSGVLSGRSASKAAQTSADAQRDAAALAAEEQRFRPVGMTTRFGSSQFGFDDDGRLSSAGYTASPEIQALQDRLSALYGQGLGYAERAGAAAAPLGGAAQGLFGLGSEYLGQSREDVRNQYLQEQYAMLDPMRQREEQRLGAGVFGRGRAGLNIGDIGQPELFSLASARRGQDLQLAAQAEQAAQQRAQFGAGLFGTGAGLLGQQYGIPTQALGPLQSYLGTIGSIEDLGQDPFKLGLAVGGASQPGATSGAGLLSAGLTQAAQTQQRSGDAASAQLTGFMNQMLGAAMGGFGGSFGGGGSGSYYQATGNPSGSSFGMYNR